MIAIIIRRRERTIVSLRLSDSEWRWGLRLTLLNLDLEAWTLVLELAMLSGRGCGG